MSGNLILIGKSGALAARGALDLTAQNIANAATEGYSRRTAEMGEVVLRGGIGLRSDTSLGGVRIDRVGRSSSLYLQNEARRTNGDLSRATAELSSLGRAESAIEQSGAFSAIIEFEASLAQLASQPASDPMRAAVLESARTLASTLNIADGGLASASQQARFEAAAGADKVTLLARELARTNVALVRTTGGSGNRAVLLDQRDALLADMGELVGVSVSYGRAGKVEVRLDGNAANGGANGGGALLVSGDQSFALETSDNPDGTMSFSVGGASATPVSGALAGRAQGLAMLRDLGTSLDGLAAQIVTLANDAQASGVDAAGNRGQTMFSGTDAGNIALTLTNGAGIAAAAAGARTVGAGAGSRDGSNLDNFRAALADGGPAASADRILFGISSAVAGRSITRDALSAIAGTAEAALTAETGVDLDTEAANLLRFQQAFQASSRVIQVASDIFDTLLAIR